MSEYTGQVETIREAFEQEFGRFADLSVDGIAVSDAEALLRDLGELKIKQTGKKSPISGAMNLFGKVAPEERSAFGQRYQSVKKNIPVINGLVLAGGKSVRMGFDKTVIEWHGKDQRSYMADALKAICNDVFISCRTEQQDEIKNYKTIADTFTGLGPYGAILSAFRENPDVAWLVTASDLPLMDKATLQYLINYRNISAVATTFESPHDGLPEPLITIWEPKAYHILLSFLAQGYSCPRKVLRNNDVHIIKAQYPEKLMNVNTEEELIKAKALLNIKTVTV